MTKVAPEDPPEENVMERDADPRETDERSESESESDEESEGSLDSVQRAAKQAELLQEYEQRDDAIAKEKSAKKAKKKAEEKAMKKKETPEERALRKEREKMKAKETPEERAARKELEATEKKAEREKKKAEERAVRKSALDQEVVDKATKQTADDRKKANIKYHKLSDDQWRHLIHERMLRRAGCGCLMKVLVTEPNVGIGVNEVIKYFRSSKEQTDLASKTDKYNFIENNVDAATGEDEFKNPFLEYKWVEKFFLEVSRRAEPAESNSTPQKTH